MVDRYPPTDLQALRADLQRQAARLLGEAERIQNRDAAEIYRHLSDNFADAARQIRWLQVQRGELPPVLNNPDRRQRHHRRR